MTAGRIQQGLSLEDKKLWASRDIKEHVVLIDWNSTGTQPTINTPMYILKDILVKVSFRRFFFANKFSIFFLINCSGTRM